MRYKLSFFCAFALCVFAVFATLMSATTAGREQAAWAASAVWVGIPALALGVLALLPRTRP